MRLDTEGWELVHEFRLPEPIKLLNAWQRMHWAERNLYTQTLGWLIREAFGVLPARPLHAAWVHVERGCHPPLPDPDGLIGGLKPLLDCLVCPRLRRNHGLGFIVDDSPQYIHRLTAWPVAAPKGQGYTHVYIYRPAAGTQRRAA